MSCASVRVLYDIAGGQQRIRRHIVVCLHQTDLPSVNRQAEAYLEQLVKRHTFTCALLRDSLFSLFSLFSVFTLCGLFEPHLCSSLPRKFHTFSPDSFCRQNTVQLGLRPVTNIKKHYIKGIVQHFGKHFAFLLRVR